MAVAKARTSLEFLFTRMNYYTLQGGWATGFLFFETKPISVPPSHPTITGTVSGAVGEGHSNDSERGQKMAERELRDWVVACCSRVPLGERSGTPALILSAVMWPPAFGELAVTFPGHGRRPVCQNTVVGEQVGPNDKSQFHHRGSGLGVASLA
jgi:hypothetical protein